MSQQAGQRNGEPAASGRPRDLMRKIRRRQAAGAAYYSAARPPIGKPDYMRPCRRDSVKPGYFAAKRTKFVCLQIFCGGANGIHSLHSIYTRGFPFLFDALPEKGICRKCSPERTLSAAKINFYSEKCKDLTDFLLKTRGFSRRKRISCPRHSKRSRSSLLLSLPIQLSPVATVRSARCRLS